jgi:hypothetical protein
MTRHFLNLSDAGGDAIAVMLNDAMDRKNARIGWRRWLATYWRWFLRKIRRARGHRLKWR